MTFIEEHGLVRYSFRVGLRKMHVGKACEGCARPGTGTGLDHCHAHDWVRGVLCGGCNYKMGAIDARKASPYHSPVLLKYWENCPDCREGAPWSAVGPPPAPRSSSGKKTSIWLSDELEASWRASGVPLAELIRRGLGMPEPGRPVDEATLRRVLREELARWRPGHE